MADIQSATAKIRRGKKKKEEEEERNHSQKYNGLPYYIGQTIKSGGSTSYLRLHSKASFDCLLYYGRRRLWNRADHYIFASGFFLLLLSSFFLA